MNADPSFRAAALTLAYAAWIGSIGRNPVAVKACAVRMRRAAKGLRAHRTASLALSVPTGDPDLSEAALEMYRRGCASCGQCRALGFKPIK